MARHRWRVDAPKSKLKNQPSTLRGGCMAFKLPSNISLRTLDGFQRDVCSKYFILTHVAPHELRVIVDHPSCLFIRLIRCGEQKVYNGRDSGQSHPSAAYQFSGGLRCSLEVAEQIATLATERLRSPHNSQPTSSSSCCTLSIDIGATSQGRRRGSKLDIPPSGPKYSSSSLRFQSSGEVPDMDASRTVQGCSGPSRTTTTSDVQDSSFIGPSNRTRLQTRGGTGTLTHKRRRDGDAHINRGGTGTLAHKWRDGDGDAYETRGWGRLHTNGVAGTLTKRGDGDACTRTESRGRGRLDLRSGWEEQAPGTRGRGRRQARRKKRGMGTDGREKPERMADGNEISAGDAGMRGRGDAPTGGALPDRDDRGRGRLEGRGRQQHIDRAHSIK
ncbi:hypothetical protein DFH29DRAFT_881695 [Suillus ampliporus]|nr:hypothetical protein DFH29DRAFT_881695 [Suillus ampliporus]